MISPYSINVRKTKKIPTITILMHGFGAATRMCATKTQSLLFLIPQFSRILYQNTINLVLTNGLWPGINATLLCLAEMSEEALLHTICFVKAQSLFLIKRARKHKDVWKLMYIGGELFHSDRAYLSGHIFSPCVPVDNLNHVSYQLSLLLIS